MEQNSQHPTDAERFFFDNNGYLVLESFLDSQTTAALRAAVERVIARRRDPGYTREQPTAQYRRFFHGFVFDPPEFRWG